MTAHAELTADLRRQVLLMETDLRERVESQPAVTAEWRAEFTAATKRERTKASWASWRDERVTQAAVAWVLTSVFIRFCEDNDLVKPVWIGGPDRRRQEALDAQREYFRAYPLDTDREWIEQGINHLGKLRATKDLVDERSALHWVPPSGDACAALLAFWRERDEHGPRRDLTDPELSTRFLGDLYQDISESARTTYALLQTPDFVEEFILDRTMEPALAERSLDGFRMIDPTCGSGHFLLGAFDRLLDRWDRHAPGAERQSQVQRALDAIHGVDINPFAVAITRFRLTIAALKACAIRRIEDAPAFNYHLAAGDSLWFGAPQGSLDYEDDALESGLAGFAYRHEDRALLRNLLQPGRYDVVVGNPPYITVKDKALNAAYRSFYPTCKGTYAMTVPFMELFFRLSTSGGDIRPAGWVGQITSNSFMKREFGAPLIEKFLVRQDLRLIIDTSGAYIPGHGTPTLIVVGRHQRPVGPTVHAVLGIRGEPGRPDRPANGIVWRSIVEHVDEHDYDDGWISTADLERKLISRHPWSLTGGGAVQLLSRISDQATKLEALLGVIGRTAHTGADECFFLPHGSINALHLVGQFVPVVLGEDVRDYSIHPNFVTIFPYDSAARPSPLADSAGRHLWRSRRFLETQLDFGQTKAERGLRWCDFSMFFPSRFRTSLSIAFPFVSTHNHFVLDRGGKVFKQTAPVVKLPEGATEDEHLALLGVLNSSTACFWLKQNSHNKGSTIDASGARTTLAPWEDFYEFTGTTLKDYPLAEVLPLDRGRMLDSLATDLSEFEPASIAREATPNREGLDAARQRSAAIRAQMIAHQEELDWEVYRQYGLLDDDLTCHGEPPKIALGERAFEIALARTVAKGDEETAWFERHGSTPITQIPTDWPAAYRDLVQRRLDVIESNPNIRLLEKPEYKRRWASEPWEKQEERALRGWLLDRLEDKRFWFDQQGRAVPRSIGQLADDVARDPDLVSVLAVWEGRPDLPVSQYLQRLLADEAVPYLAAYRYKESGLRKRADWDNTWALQRREDAGEDVQPIPVPPKYTTADFVKASYWQARGKLDVPKERFIAYPDAGRDTDPTPVIGWAGWDHAQQSLALGLLIGQREQDGWSDERLIPLVAGLAELQPWVDQWHGDIDPNYGFSLAEFCREELTKRAQQVGRTVDQLAAWRPPRTAARRGRRPKGGGAQT